MIEIRCSYKELIPLLNEIKTYLSKTDTESVTFDGDEWIVNW